MDTVEGSGICRIIKAGPDFTVSGNYRGIFTFRQNTALRVNASGEAKVTIDSLAQELTGNLDLKAEVADIFIDGKIKFSDDFRSSFRSADEVYLMTAESLKKHVLENISVVVIGFGYLGREDSVVLDGKALETLIIYNRLPKGGLSDYERFRRNYGAILRDLRSIWDLPNNSLLLLTKFQKGLDGIAFYRPKEIAVEGKATISSSGSSGEVKISSGQPKKEARTVELEGDFALGLGNANFWPFPFLQLPASVNANYARISGVLDFQRADGIQKKGPESVELSPAGLSLSVPEYRLPPYLKHGSVAVSYVGNLFVDKRMLETARNYKLANS